MGVSIDQFNALEIKIGTVEHVERVPDSDKLLNVFRIYKRGDA